VNIHQIITAIENLDHAVFMTFQEHDRKTLVAANSILLDHLQKSGVFVGGEHERLSQIERFRLFENRLRAWKMDTFKTGTPVFVNADSYHGVGITWMTGNYGTAVDVVEVLIENGNSWIYPIERCKVIPWDEVPRSNRRSYLRKKGYKLL